MRPPDIEKDMKLQSKLLLYFGLVLILAYSTIEIIGYVNTKDRMVEELRHDARQIRSLLMATRRIYHRQFLDSGVGLDMYTIGFLPAHALSRISEDLSNWSEGGLSFNNVTDRPRNPRNQADQYELQAMEYFRSNPDMSERIVPIEEPSGESYYHYTSPIWVEQYCLKCHGAREDAPQTIRDTYSSAYDYKLGELRGVMSIKLPTATIEQLIYNLRGKEALGRAVAYIISLLLGIWLLRRYVIRRLTQIQLAAHKLSEGDYSYAVNIDGADEISDVAQAFVDMTLKRHQVEGELIEKEKKFRKILESAHDAVITIDHNQKIEIWNHAAEKTFGYNAVEVIGMDLADLIVPERFRAAHREGVAQFLRTGRARLSNEVIETIGQQADGTEIPIELSLSITYTSGEMYIVGIVRDLRDKKETESQLRILVEAMEQSPESIVITNLDAEIEYVNAAFIERTGYSIEEVIGKNPRFLSSGKTPAEDYRDMWSSLLRGESWKGEFYNVRKDGTEYVEFARLVPIQQPGEGITHYVAIKEDITEKKENALMLDEYRSNLEDLVLKRTAQLANAKEQAEAANKAKSSFLANMSHEIRTPMNAIIGFSHILRNGDTSPEQDAQLAKLDASAKHLLTIINDILDISKIEAGKLTLEETNFNLDGILDDIASIVHQQASNKGLTIRIEQNLDQQWFYGDPTRLRQTLLNYLGNAIKFSDHGEIVVRALLEDRDDSGYLIRLEVTDQGIGIAKEKQEKLFNAFQQADNSITRVYGGTGLGLFITRHIAHMMGGEAGVESNPGSGSTFWISVRLPLGTAPSSAAIPLATLEECETELRAHHAGSRILLVEDNAINAEVAISLLTGVGLSVEHAENGQIALEMVQKDSYDLMLMDLQMPVMDGLEATRQIRALPSHQEIPILAMSANIFEEDRRACKKVGMNDFVAKPVDPNLLFTTLMNWLPESDIAPDSLAPVAETDSPQTESDPQLTDELQTLFADYDGIEIDKGLGSMRGDIAAYLRLLRRFDSDHGGDMERLRQVRRDGEPADNARIIAHTIKGASGTLGLMRLHKRAEKLEHAIKQHGAELSDEEIEPLIEAVVEEQQLLHRIFADHDAHTVSNSEEDIDSDSVTAVVEQLVSMLKADDATAYSLYVESEPLLTKAFGPQIEPVRKQIEGFNFPAALKELKQLTTQ